MPRAQWIGVATIAMALALPVMGYAQTAEPPAAKAPAKRVKAAPASDAPQSAPQATKRDPAAAQATVESGAKLLEAGKTDQAVATLSSAISGGNLPPTVMARALYLRGSAYRKLSKSGLAISDLTSALWLKGGLNDADRADATQQRVAAYSEAGLGDQGQPGAASRVSAKKRADSTTAEASTSSGGFFGNLFGGSTPTANPEPRPEPAAAPKAVRPQPNAPAAAAAPATYTPAAGASAKAATPAPAAQSPPASIAAATVTAGKRPAVAQNSEGSFQSRIALVKTRGEADAIAAKLKGQHAVALAGKAPSVDEATFGSMGTFFQVRVGPYANAAEASALCSRLKGSGLDCVAVNN